MNKNYVCTKEKISEALDDVDSFITLMETFNEKHDKNYKYNIEIEELTIGKDKWSIKLTLIKDDKE